jgi:mono/diheme cytochrome c family protein
MRTKRYILLIVTIAILFAIDSCNKTNPDIGSLYTPTSADVTAKATLQELQQGRTLYINNCSICHGLYSPDSYTPTQWKSILSSMAPRTDMTSSQIQLVTKYVCRGKQ